VSSSASTAVIVAAAAFVVMAIVMIIAAAKLWRAADAANDAISRAREELIPLLRESRETVRNADSVVASANEKLGRVDRILTRIEQLLSGVLVAGAASKAAHSSSVALTGIIEGLKAGLRVLRGAPKQTKEGSGNE
jgi:uncharacterized protein YoxC